MRKSVSKSKFIDVNMDVSELTDTDIKSIDRACQDVHDYHRSTYSRLNGGYVRVQVLGWENFIAEVLVIYGKQSEDPEDTLNVYLDDYNFEKHEWVNTKMTASEVKDALKSGWDGTMNTGDLPPHWEEGHQQ